jgi:hypothetical protein
MSSVCSRFIFIILITSIDTQKRSVEARILRQMPFLVQPSPFPGLELAPPMAPEIVSLASWEEPRWNPCHSLIIDYLSILIEGKTANLGYSGKPWV